MGNFYCIRANCARVTWRSYLPPTVRWRYPNESWQEIEGDDYALETIPYQCPAYYKVRYYEFYGSNNTNRSSLRSLNVELVGPLVNHQLVRFSTVIQSWTETSNSIISPPVEYKTFYFLDVENFTGQILRTRLNGSSVNGIEIVNYQRFDGQPDNCGDCTFTITKNGEIIHEETRNDCPEVEVLPCRLEEISKEIKIEKTPYLERVEVVDYFYDVRYGLITDSDNYGLLLLKGKIPDNCLNIYSNPIATLPPLDLIPITNTPEVGFRHVTQICSAPGCPPPSYEVICNCDEECPDGTCAVTCNDAFCCYDPNTGVAIKRIPFSDFFPSNTVGASE